MPNENNDMLFNSFEFILFLLPVLALTLLLNRSGSLPWRNGVLLLASYAFYAWLNPWYPLLLLYITAVNYGGGYLLLREYASRTRYLIITVILLASLSPLAFCKYAPLFGSSVWLPIGLSFFTFQALSYSLDLYRQKSNIRAPFADYALFVCFFPTLLSGPIERSRNLIPQLQSRFPVSWDGVAEGCQSFVWGPLQKSRHCRPARAISGPHLRHLSGAVGQHPHACRPSVQHPDLLRLQRLRLHGRRRRPHDRHQAYR